MSAGILFLVSTLTVLWFVLVRPYSTKLPDLPESLVISEQVSEQIEKASGKAARWPSADNLGRYGMVLHSSANYHDAASCYELAIQRDPSAWMWEYYLGYLYLEMGESENVLQHFQSVIDQYPGAFHAWYYCGEVCRNQGLYDLAEHYFNGIAGIDKRNSGSGSTREEHFPLGTYARFQLSRIYAETGRTDLAESSLRGLIQSNTIFGPAYRMLGSVYSMRGETDLSKLFGVRANDFMAFSPPVDTLVDLLGMISRSERYLLKKIDEAVNSVHPAWARKLIGQGLIHMPDNKDLISKAIEIYLWTDSPDMANKHTGKHQSLYRENYEEMYKMGMLFLQKDQYAMAADYFSRADQLKPGDPETMKQLAISLWKTGEKQQSYAILQGILEIHPDNIEMLAEITNVMLFEMEERNKAINNLIALTHYLPSDPRVQKMTAWMEERSGRIPEAIALYESSLRSDPEDLTTIKNLGALLMGRQMWERSIAHFHVALEHHPNEPYFLERMGSLLVNCPDTTLRDVEAGRIYAERAFLHYKAPPMTAVAAGRSLAIAYDALGERQNAVMVIDMTMDIARRADLSNENMAVLEKLAMQLK